MSARKPVWGGWAPMPEVGTMKICQFCHMAVTLQKAPRGSYLWVADRDPIDGARHCLGGQPPGTSKRPSLTTLHLPDRSADGEPQLAWWYTAKGEPRGA